MILLCPIFSVGQKTFAELKTEYDVVYAQNEGRSEMIQYSLSDGDHQEYYYMNWNLTGVISAWQATGDISYFNDAKLVVDNTISKTKNITINGETYLGWPEPGHSTGFELWDSMYWKEVATFLRIIHQSPNFIGSQREWFDSVLAFTERNIWDRYEAKGSDGNLYSYKPGDTSHWARIAMELYIITGKQKYKTFFDNVSFNGCTCPETLKGSSFRSQLFNNTSVIPTANNISWTWGQTTSGEVPDVPHLAALVQFIALAAENGMYWNQGANQNDIAKWVSTFNNVVWTDNQPIKGSYYADGTGEKNNYPISQGVQAILGRFDSEFQVRMENYLLQDVFNRPMIAGLLLLNRKILDDGSPVYPENYTNPNIGTSLPVEDAQPAEEATPTEGESGNNSENETDSQTEETTSTEEQPGNNSENETDSQPVEETTPVEDQSSTQTIDGATPVYIDGMVGPLKNGNFNSGENLGALKAHPNPTEQDFTVILPNKSKKTSYSLFSIEGSLIKQGTMADGHSTLALNISNCQQGLYILNIYSSTKKYKPIKIMKGTQR